MEDKGFYILSSNLVYALASEIERRKVEEREANYFSKSAYLAGLESNLEYLKENHTLEVRGSIY